MTTETLAKPILAPRAVSRPLQTDPPPQKPGEKYGRLPRVIVYPDSDGQPMAESDFQFEPLSYSVESLKLRYLHRPDVYAAGNIFFYYEEGDPSKFVAPDVLVIIGEQKRKRSSVKLWEEPHAPDFVLEITSSSTRSTDQGTKKGLYEYLGVTEYFCFDPTADYLDPPLMGYRLQGGRYVPIEPKEVTPTTVVMSSAVLGLDLRVVEHEFRFVDPTTGQTLLNLVETEEQRLLEQRRRLDEERRRLDEERRRIEAEARVRELEAELAAAKAVAAQPPT